MLRSYEALVVAEGEKTVALRLLTSIVMGWDLVPVTAQIRLVQDACLINGDGAVASLPDEVLAFINSHKDRPL